MQVFLIRSLAAIGLVLAVMIAGHYWPDLVSIFHDSGDQPVPIGQLESPFAVVVFLIVVGTTIIDLAFLFFPYRKAG